MDVVVTGAGGCLGAHIAMTLADAGYGVRAVVRSLERASFLRHPRIQCHQAALSQELGWDATFEGAQALVHAAALGSKQGSLQDLLETNVAGTRWVLRRASEAGLSRIIHISSASVVRTQLNRPISDEAAFIETSRRHWSWSDLTTDWRYARSKALAEATAFEQAQYLGLELTALRFGPLFGLHDKKASARMVTQLRERSHVLAPTVKVPWLWAGEAARAVKLSLEHPETVGRALLLAGGAVSQYEVLQTLKHLIGLRTAEPLARLVKIPLPLGVHYDCRLARELMGFEPAPVSEGLAAMVKAWPL